MKSFLAGLGIGVAVGVLVAPKRGQELRQQLRDSFDETMEEGRDSADHARRKLRRRVKEFKQQVTPGAMALLVVLNDWPEERLIEIDGIGPVLASKIIQNRPYESADEFVESKILPPSAIEALRNAA